jgi:MYXO-CTERM domain-containing protein
VEYGHSFIGTVTGHNAGDSCLTVTHFSSIGMCQPIDNGPTGFDVAPGETFSRNFVCTVSLQDFPTTTIELECPFEAQDIQTFDFSVEPSGGALVSFSDAIEFTGSHEVAVGSSATLPVEVFNLGANPTDLVTITSTDSRLTAAPAAGSLPVTIGAGESALIDVTFTPTGAGRTSGAITFGVSLGMGFTQPVVGDGVIGVAGQPASSTRQLALGDADDPEIAGAAPAANERARSGGCQTGEAGGLVPMAGLAGLAALFMRRRRPAR